MLSLPKLSDVHLTEIKTILLQIMSSLHHKHDILGYMTQFIQIHWDFVFVCKKGILVRKQRIVIMSTCYWVNWFENIESRV